MGILGDFICFLFLILLVHLVPLAFKMMCVDAAVGEYFLAGRAEQFVGFFILSFSFSCIGRPSCEISLFPLLFEVCEGGLLEGKEIFQWFGASEEVSEVGEHRGEVDLVMVVLLDFECKRNFLEDVELLEIPRVVTYVVVFRESDLLLLQVEAEEIVVEEVYVDILPCAFVRCEEWLSVWCLEDAFADGFFVDDLHCGGLRVVFLVVFLDVLQSLSEVYPHIRLTVATDHTLLSFEDLQFVLSRTVEILEENERVHAFALLHLEEVLQLIVHDNRFSSILKLLEHQLD